MLRAKRAIEALLEAGSVFVDLPAVENDVTLAVELANAGIAAAEVAPSLRMPDIDELREHLP